GMRLRWSWANPSAAAGGPTALFDGGEQRAVRRADEAPDLGDRLVPLGDQVRENGEDVRLVVPDLQLARYAGRRETFGHQLRVRVEHLVRTHLDQHGRQAAQVRVDRALAGVLAALRHRALVHAVGDLRQRRYGVPRE